MALVTTAMAGPFIPRLPYARAEGAGDVPPTVPDQATGRLSAPRPPAGP